MACYITEFFCYSSTDHSEEALKAAAKKKCPATGNVCIKSFARDNVVSGVCAIRQKKADSPSVICCPQRLYAEDYKMLQVIAKRAFKHELKLYAGRTAVEKAKSEGGAIAVFGKGWGGELRLPQRKGQGSYFVDWVLVRLNGEGEIEELTAIEVQTIDTTGSYRTAREALAKNREVIGDTAGLNWENVSKRIIPQIIYKGQVLQREELCRTGLYLVCPKPVYDRIIDRLGGTDKLPSFPSQPASINFIAYDICSEPRSGEITPLGIVEEHSTTVYKVQEAFSSMTLPDGNVYRDAISKILYPERFKL